MIRTVLDTNVVVSALLWAGPPRELLKRNGANFLFFTSPPLLAELADVLARPKFSGRIATSGLSVDDLVQTYARTVLVIRPASTPRIAPDPDDDVVIGTALAAGAELIVTGDAGLLSISHHQAIQIASVQEALQASSGAK